VQEKRCWVHLNLANDGTKRDLVCWASKGTGKCVIIRPAASVSFTAINKAPEKETPHAGICRLPLGVGKENRENRI
jgi:hypothetical protein